MQYTITKGENLVKTLGQLADNNNSFFTTGGGFMLVAVPMASSS